MKIINLKFILNSNVYKLLIILALSFNSVSVAFSQDKTDEPKLTEAERKEAEEIAIRFALRFSQTKDLTPLLPELFSEHFTELCKIKMSNDVNKNTAEVFLSPGLFADAKILKQLNTNDCKNIYTSTNNFYLSLFGVMLKAKIAGKEKDADKFIDKAFSPRLEKLFSPNPYLTNIFKDNVGNTKPIDSVDELRNTLELLNQGTKIFNEDNKVSFTEKELRIFFINFTKSKGLKVEIESSDKDYPYFPKKTRVITIVSPNLYFLTLVREKGKLKIISTIPYAE